MKRMSSLVNFCVSFAATFVRALFTLALVKAVSVFGGAGSLSALGVMQNSLAIGSSLATMSTQSGVSARLASGADEQAFRHAIHISIFGLTFLGSAIGILYFFAITFPLNVYWFLFLLASAGLGCNGLVASALVGYGKLDKLVYMYFSSGLATLIWVLISGSYNHFDFACSIGFGSWVGASVGSFHIPKNRPFFNINVALAPQYAGLVKFGFSSLASVLSINGVLLIARNSVLESGSGFDSDVFEVGIRLNSLLEMFIIVPMGPVIIAALVKAKSSSIDKARIYFLGAAFSVALCLSAAGFLLLAGDFVVRILFSEKFISVLDYLHLIMGVQFIRCVAAVAVLKQMIAGHITFLIFNEFLYIFSFCCFLNFLPYEAGSLTLVYTSILLAVCVYATLPSWLLFRNN